MSSPSSDRLWQNPDFLRLWAAQAVSALGSRLSRTALPVIAILSLGAERRFLVRPVDGGPSTAWSPVSGDLIVMGGRCQTDWRHSVPKQATGSGARISVNFRASSQGRPD